MNSIKNNKKHPLDELFRQKLSGFEMEPSLEAKERFLASINAEESSKKPFWFFSAAAAVILISGLSWFFLNNSPKIDTNSALAELSVESTIEETPKVLENTFPVPEIVNRENLNTRTSAESSIPSKKGVQKKEQNVIQKTLQPKPVRSITGIIETDELIQDRLTLALQAAEEKKSKAEVNLESNDLFKTSVGETIIIVASTLNTEEIYLPEINSDSPITLAEAENLGSSILEEDRSLMAKVFTELKHLKHGERASFNSITASNEESIINNEDGFIGHETMQFRERFRWFKGKLSKQ
ncbi:hypothetical protein [Arcticibacterium luteifluviistationis]|uniref:Uncharacterized protein n=1 Tax=Arcticibacterium luteifluviistationis TaxID=1784714 RepID=A0A2Z4GDS3_9BACT|nr:hypothetical protein [Arcticibacterium luteifluviistationis]AWV99314.1 hypothetical protein DJ013_14520 [Arcticibacterium luteifluviistationis]